MNTILIPTDFSPAATNAMNYALDLAAVEGSKVILLHVTPGSILEKEDAEARAKEKLIWLHSQITGPKKIGCDRILSRGNAGKEILRVSEEIRPDLIVVGMRGQGEGLQRIIGRTAREIIEKAKCPVMAVPEKASFKEITKITYATDYHQSDIRALKTLAEMAAPLNAGIELLHVAGSDPDPGRREAMMKKFSDKVRENTGFRNLSYRVLPGRNIQEELEEYSRQDSAGLLVMSTHNRGIIDKIFGKSITKHITLHTSVPLLVFHHKEKPVIFIFGLAIMK
jgi:nucleotide-binding universal stress UspA family protein